MKCPDGEKRTQLTGRNPGKSEEEEWGQGAPHRAPDLQAPVAHSPGMASRIRIKWPSANIKGKWKEFDNDIAEILQAAARGDLDQRLNFKQNLIG